MQGVGPGTSLGGRDALRTRLSHRSDLEHWSAHDTTLERDVAVTVFDGNHPHAAAVLDAARRAAGVEDSRLARILDVGSAGGVSWIIEESLASAESLATLLQQGLLPADPTFTLLFGTGGLINESFRAAFFSDQNNGFKAAAQKNTLLGWTPKRPVALCGGAQDPTVFFYNSTDLQADFATRNVLVPTFDLETRATLPAGAVGDQIYGGFQQQKTNAGTNATALYHGSLVPPFCHALERGFFQTVLASGQ